MTMLLRVLQDTRDIDTPNVCAKCGGAVIAMCSDTANDYSVYVYECNQCGAIYSTICQCYHDET